MLRLLATLLFMALMCATTDCQAQRTRRLFSRNARAVDTTRNLENRTHPYQFKSSQYQPRNTFVTRLLDGPTPRARNPAEVDSRYFGGFHQSYFENIGIPPGDVGLRGNALYWKPW